MKENKRNKQNKNIKQETNKITLFERGSKCMGKASLTSSG